MKFKRIQRPKLPGKPRTAPKIVRSNAVVCPWCGAVESLRARSTQRRGRQIFRYSVCTSCGRPVTRIVEVPV